MSEQPPVRIEIEVEYVRTETIVFTGDLSSGLSSPGVPWEVGRFMSLLQYHIHCNKDLVKRESPRLIGWQILDIRCICNRGDAHEHKTVAHLNRCARCMCSCPPEDAIVDA